MYRAILPEGEIHCDEYEMAEEGVALYTDTDELIAFVPFSNLRVLINEDVYESNEGENERSIM